MWFRARSAMIASAGQLLFRRHDMSDQAARFIGSIPQNYDKGLGPRIFVDYADNLSGRVADLNPRSVLELAAGTGIVTRKLRDSLPADTHLVASDLNPPMLEVARAKFRADETVEFKQIDATNIEFDDESFDVVTCQFGVMFFPDKDRSYSEVRRVLRPGGSYVFNVWDSWAANPFARITHEAVEKFFPDDPPGFYRVPFSYHDEDELRESVFRAGFSTVDVEYVGLQSKIPSAADFAQGLVFGNPLFDEIVSRGGDPVEVRTAVATAIDKELGGEMPLQALVVHASLD
jgi:ubiquinone/menaquinone biosynthesis C-methylase UbiE